MNKLVLGILAHVDAGKTTLSEGILYTAGCLRKLGRVDHRDTFLDTETLERERGITIFSKQAVFPLGETEVTLLDTPGHVDFSAEAERVLSVLDAAVLVISGSDGIQGHTETLWRLLSRYHLPVLLFINKVDLLDNASPGGEGRKAVMESLRKRFGDGCIDFSQLEEDPDAFYEQAAVCGDELLESFLDRGHIPDELLKKAVANREIFPCCFGSALKMDGVDRLLSLLGRLVQLPEYGEDFGARVFKVSRDNSGARLTFMKITGGGLAVKTLLSGVSGGQEWQEKADQLRVYSGAKYKLTDYAPAGSIIAVTGLSKTLPGDGLGFEENAAAPVLVPVLTYRLQLPEDVPVYEAFRKLSQLEEEDPQLHMVWNEQLSEIHVQLMGEVQLEILQRLIADRFGMEVTFGEGNIVYKETILNTVEGVGHFEPLRHYAEVHLLMEPGEPGSGLVFDTVVSEDDLDRNWQRLILTHLGEKEHLGVLTGNPITDMKITLVAGKAHLKHTEGGDFRQATYRAVRQGLMQAESVLLEPYYSFQLELPSENVGRAMHDIEQRFGEFDTPGMEDGMSILTGSAPVSCMRDYQKEVTAYTRGRGRLTLRVKGYQPCHNADEVIAAFHYNPEADMENSPDSVFCSHGAGVVVRWMDVPSHMHLAGLELETEEQPPPQDEPAAPITGRMIYSGTREEDRELEAIFTRTYGEIKRRDFLPQNTVRQLDKAALLREMEDVQEFLLVDGYNIIFAWDELKSQAAVNLDAARQALVDILCNYQGYKQCGLIVVFDAYRVKGGKAKVERQNDVYIVYTEEAETADMYIEKVTYALGRDPVKKRRVRVATSDNLEQTIILGHGSTRISAGMFYDEVKRVEARISEMIAEQNRRGAKKRARLADSMPELPSDEQK
ncbi:MAG TPA: TetM/TetW/TetO/TetS family tetracycline resistance ribosomal protection protein [Candidatus Faecivivens stercoripullorum]|uniref:TetM/TetW/TetO/TetS family tetracycline resistance ribosomal protection protein n=1 Tax=Candidatus Faecivivens stercoripullorum TaxID=2840805 RepID=A0A9D1KT84_9FIRM|nr:TetM/TetW/TetO/TetS family tetracycline resistance ribosomal protection protein [Candidatus Faecivivens stercoripullorum]